MSKFTIKGFTPKDATWKSEFFAYVISRRQSTNQQKKLLRNSAFHVGASPSVGNWLGPAKMTIGPKSDIPYFSGIRHTRL